MDNPFPGLRPYEPEEDHLFFGREKETDDLVRRLRAHRFLSVVGTSGSGKSSLVRSGLIPSLQSGLMVSAGSSWRIAIFRPGEDPVGHLADALNQPDVIGTSNPEMATTNRVLIETTLRRGALGLADAVRLARIPHADNVLVLVDQFEELFRFRRGGHVENSRDEAVAFVKLLLEASRQSDLPVYVVLTMRSDFIGDCMDYPGLPEAVNESQYLVPRMTRDELRSAITGPVAVAGGQIAPRLVVRLLNDVGDDPDQLPLLQHVLSRSWAHWAAHGADGHPLDLADYEAVGTLRHALSQHAEEAYAEVPGERTWLAAAIFKALTDTFSDPRGVRRPTSVDELVAICESSQADVAQIVEIFRRPGRSFLMPPSSVPLAPDVVVDISHESLMRCWERLIRWAQEERTAAAQYVRLSRQATWYEEGTAGLWGDPELELALRWRRDNRPTAAWARRYDESFDGAMQFLDRSERERERQRLERRTHRIRRLQLAWGSAGVLLVVLIVFVYLAYIARQQGQRAEDNLLLANEAVDQTLAAMDTTRESIAAESPDTQLLRKDLLGRAASFYQRLVNQSPTNEAFLTEQANAHLRLGHISRALGDGAQAEREYRSAVQGFGDLARARPTERDYQRALGNADNWLGEALRPIAERAGDAEQAYARALEIQESLTRADPASVQYVQDLARTHYNRGILYGSSATAGDKAFGQSEADFRAAIALLQPLVDARRNRIASQGLARASNNLASLLQQDPHRVGDARTLYTRAIDTHEGLVTVEPGNREYKLELAKFCNNLSDLLRDLGELRLAVQYSDRAVELMNLLARPAPALVIEQADAHNLRGRLLDAEGSQDAIDEYRVALQTYTALYRGIDPASLGDFHLRFGDLLLNLAASRQAHRGADGAARIWSDAIKFYLSLGQQAVAANARGEAQNILANLTRLEPFLSGSDRQALSATMEALQRTAGSSAGR
jgi:tetratricopeptide (TPR) repeat protein